MPALAHPFEVRSGGLHLPDVPGNGLGWDEDAVAHYQAQWLMRWGELGVFRSAAGSR